MTPLTYKDFYKTDHRRQYPEGTTKVYSNFTPRSDKYFKGLKGFDHKIIWFGLQMFIKDYIIKEWNEKFFNQPKEKVVNRYKRRLDTSLGKDSVPVEHIEALHDLGYLPLRIKALPEGSQVPMKVPVLTVTNTLPEFYWLVNDQETVMSSELWKPTTVATIAFQYRKLFEKYDTETGPTGCTLIQGHDFSARGLSGRHDMARSGTGHLLSFIGTDTIPAIDTMEDYYNADAEKEIIGVSVPASEHSVMCLGTQEAEIDTIRRLITQIYPSGIVSVVSDSWDFFKVITEYATQLKDEILNRQPILDPEGNVILPAKTVFRPDCYDEETEVMTRGGWKYFKDLTGDDLVGQVTSEGLLEFVKPSRVIDQEYSGEMIEFSDHFGKVDLLVTPNHRMIFKYPKSGKIKAQEAEKATFYNKKVAFRSASLPGLGGELTPWDRLRVAFQADGSFPSKVPVEQGVISGSKTIRFNFAKKRKADRLERILLDGGWKYTKSQYPSRKGQWTFYVWLPIQTDIQKNLDWVETTAINCGDWCRDFIEELSYWDSCRRHDHRFKFDTTKEDVASKAMDVAILGGYGVLRSHYKDERKNHFSDVHTLHILSDNTIDTQAFTKKKVHYTGRVYCVTVPSGMVLVKRNKCTMVSGNSGDPVKILTGYLPSEVVRVPCTFISGNNHYCKETGKELTCEELKGAVECLWDIFGGTTTDTGYKLLDSHVGLIYGDSITLERAEKILRRLKEKGFASGNVVFGIGSYTYQMNTRDTFGFAMKATYGEVNGEAIELFKDPKTDSGVKRSAKGLLRVELEDGEYKLYDQQTWEQEAQGELRTVFEDGKLLIDESLSTIRSRVETALQTITDK